MKNRSRLVKLLFLFVFLLIVLLMVIIFLLLKMFFFNDNHDRPKEILTNTYILKDISNISFEFKKANVTIKTTDEDDLVITQNTDEDRLYLNSNMSSNTLFFSEDSYMFDSKELKYTIKIPKAYDGIININNGFGTLKIYNIKNYLVIDNNSADVNIHKTNDMTIKNVSGKVNLYDISGNLSISSSTGNININDITGILNIDSLTGDINIDNYKIEGNSNIENISGNITIVINKDSTCKLKYSNDKGENNINKNICIGKRNILDIKNVTGNINIK